MHFGPKGYPFTHPVPRTSGFTTRQAPPDAGGFLRGSNTGYGGMGTLGKAGPTSPAEPSTTVDPTTAARFRDAAQYLTDTAAARGTGKSWNQVIKGMPRWVGQPASNTVGALLRVSIVYAGLARVTIGFAGSTFPSLSNPFADYPPGYRNATMYAVGTFGLAASQAALSPVTYAGGWWASWLADSVSAATTGLPGTRSADPAAVAAIYQHARALADRLAAVGLRDADQASAYLRKLQNMGTSDDRNVVDVLRDAGGKLGDVGKDLLEGGKEFFTEAAGGGDDGRRRIKWGTVAVVGGLAVAALIALAPYARLATEVAEKVPDARRR